LNFFVLTSTSPIGVAPPVRDDCAPMGRTLGDASQSPRLRLQTTA
jgi:hypothetical protein